MGKEEHVSTHSELGYWVEVSGLLHVSASLPLERKPVPLVYNYVTITLCHIKFNKTRNKRLT